jgi:hypothetical protein
VISEAAISPPHTWEERVCFTCYKNPAAYFSGECLQCEEKETENYARQWAKGHTHEILSSLFYSGFMDLEMDEDLELKHRRQEKDKERTALIKQKIKKDVDSFRYILLCEGNKRGVPEREI